MHGGSFLAPPCGDNPGRSADADLSLVLLALSHLSGSFWPPLPAPLPSAGVKAQVRLQRGCTSSRTAFQVSRGHMAVPTVLHCLCYSRKRTSQPRSRDLSTGARSGPCLVCSPPSPQGGAEQVPKRTVARKNELSLFFCFQHCLCYPYLPQISFQFLLPSCTAFKYRLCPTGIKN